MNVAPDVEYRGVDASAGEEQTVFLVDDRTQSGEVQLLTGDQIPKDEAPPRVLPPGTLSQKGAPLPAAFFYTCGIPGCAECAFLLGKPFPLADVQGSCPLAPSCCCGGCCRRKVRCSAARWAFPFLSAFLVCTDYALCLSTLVVSLSTTACRPALSKQCSPPPHAAERNALAAAIQGYQSVTLEGLELLVAETPDGRLSLADSYIYDASLDIYARPEVENGLKLPSEALNYVSVPWVEEDHGEFLKYKKPVKRIKKVRLARGMPVDCAL